MTIGQTTPGTPPSIPVFRMTPEAYQKMEKELPPPKVSREDTDLIAGQRLGVQLALQYIRDHFVVR